MTFCLRAEAVRPLHLDTAILSIGLELDSRYGLDPRLFGTHSLRRTTLIYRRRGTYEPFSFCCATRRLNAQFDILGSKSTTPSQSLSKSMSELPGQSGLALPQPYGRVVPMH